jgi:hypothetical protein
MAPGGNQGYGKENVCPIIRSMFSLFAVFGVFGVNALLSAKYGQDSRRPNDTRSNW